MNLQSSRATTPEASHLVPSVRQADAGDAAEIADLIHHAYHATAAETPLVDGEEASEGVVRKLQERGYFLVLDRQSGGLAAAIYVEMRRRRGHFDLLSVAPDCQGHGLGRRLVAVAEALCEAEGCTAMDLQVTDVRAELPPWYRSLGYREAGAHGLASPAALMWNPSPGHARGGSDQVITMTKALA